MDAAGNASSVHAAGRRARDIAERGRAAVAALVGVRPEQVIFTSGGTEANAQVIANAIHGGARRLIVSAAEHPCVAKAADASGAAVETWPINRDGVVELAWLEERLARWDA